MGVQLVILDIATLSSSCTKATWRNKPNSPGDAFIPTILDWFGIDPCGEPWWGLAFVGLQISGFIITDLGSNTDVVTDAEASADVILLKMFPHFTEGDLEIAWSPTDRSGGVFEWEDPDTHDMVFGVNKFE